MIIKQVINNNVVVSEDKKGTEIIVIGKGIGFNGKKGDVIQEKKIVKTFTLKNEKEKNSFSMMIAEIPYDIIEFAIEAGEYIKEKCSKKISKRIILSLVDHIDATIERYRQGISLGDKLLWDIQYLYREEYEIAKEICQKMNNYFDIKVDESEASFITLHIINSQMELNMKDAYKATGIIDTSIKTIEEYFGKDITQNEVHFQRFVTHLQYFAKRMIQKTFLSDQDTKMNNFIQMQYPEEYLCAKKIKEKIEYMYRMEIAEDECTYLTIHIARLLK